MGKRLDNIFRVVGLGMFGIVGVIIFIGVTAPRDTVAPEVAVAVIDKSPEMQEERQGFIQARIAEGYFQKIEVPGNLPRLWVMPTFLSLSFDQKQNLVSVVYAYYFDGGNSGDTVRIFNAITGQEIGQFSGPHGGLRIDS